MPKEYPDPQSWNFVSNMNSLVLGVQTIGTMGKLDARHLTLAQKRGTQMGGGVRVAHAYVCDLELRLLCGGGQQWCEITMMAQLQSKQLFGK